MILTDAIVIRHATHADSAMLDRLAALDSREPLAGPALIGEVDGIARVALDLHDGSVAADPFVPTAELVELLRHHAGGDRTRRRLRQRTRSAHRRRRPVTVRA